MEGVLPTPQAGCHNGGTRILRQFSFPCTKKGPGHGVLVNFSAKFINEYYNLDPVNFKAYGRPHETPNYPEVLRILTNGQGDWKHNNEGHAVHLNISYPI